jgi:hypothetical protein
MIELLRMISGWYVWFRDMMRLYVKAQVIWGCDLDAEDDEEQINATPLKYEQDRLRAECWRLLDAWDEWRLF